MIERHQIISREQWLNELRPPYVTASVAAALIGAHDYMTPLKLWHLKAGTLADDPEVTPAMGRGTLMEGPAFELLQRDYPELHVEWNGTPGKVDGYYFCDPAARLGATPDAFATCAERGPGVIQVKSIEGSEFRKKWIDPDTREVVPPIGVVIQAIVEAHLTGSNFAKVAAIVVGHGIDLHLIDAPIHPGVIDRIRTEVAQLWDSIGRGIPPAADYGRDGALIAKLFPTDDGSEIDLSADNLLPQVVADLEASRADKKSADAREKVAKAIIQEKMGAARFARLADGRRISNATVDRKGYVVEPTTYRAIKILNGRAA